MLMLPATRKPNIQIIGSAQGYRNSGGTVDLSVPAHADGDRLYVLATVDNSAFLTTVPAGWTQLALETSTARRLGLYYRIADSEPASYTWESAAACMLLSFSVRGATGHTVGAITATVSDTSSPFTQAFASTATYLSGRLLGLCTVDNDYDITGQAFTVTGHTFSNYTTNSGGAAGSGGCVISLSDGLSSGASVSGTASVSVSAATGTGIATLLVALK